MSIPSFDASLLSPLPPASVLPPTLTLRPLHSDDFEKGFDRIYEALVTSDTALTGSAFDAFFQDVVNQVPKVYYTIVLCTTEDATPKSRIVGVATLLVERKLLRGGSVAGHIEDVVIAPSHQGQKLGKVLIDACVSLASRLGCYKVILDCERRNVGFYEKCQFIEKGVEMKMYL